MRIIRSVVVAVLAVLAAGGCALLPDGGPAAFLPRTTPSNTDMALAALARADYHDAAEHARAALAADASDPYALFAAAVANERVGRHDVARPYYRLLAGTRTDARTPLTQSASEAGLADIAQRALRRLEAAARSSTAPDSAPEVKVAGGPMVEEVTEPAPPPRIDGLSPHVVRRFHVLKRLLDEGLITPEEYRSRRQANLGALLPLSHPPPAPGLERPVPDSEAIVGRLHGLRRALEVGALSPRAHAVERQAILDALLPAMGGQGSRPPAPNDMLALAAARGRVERLVEAGLVSPDEAGQEVAALRKATMVGQEQGGPSERHGALAANTEAGKPFLLLPQRPGETGAAPPPKSAVPETRAAPEWADPPMAVHLASYRDRESLERGWRELQRRFSALSGLDLVVSRVDLGPEKGIFYRLKAGPLPDKAAAQQLCRTLKRQGQYCQPAFFSA